MGLVSFVPVVGWVLSGSYFLVNGIVEQLTGHSIGSHLYDYLNNREVQKAFVHMAPTFGL